MLHHGRPGASYDDAFWASLHDLQDLVFPGLRAGIEHARGFGVHWEEVTTPFAWMEGGRVLAHVGVLAHPLRLAGEDRVAAGIHAVCTHPDARGRGLGRRCMDAAMAWVDTRFDLAKLSTDIPDYYARWGFRVAPTVRFVADRAGGGGAGRPATGDDVGQVRRIFASRRPTSEVFATRDDGWLPVIDLALQERLPGGVILSPSGAWLAVVRPDRDALVLDDVVGDPLPPVEAVLDAVPFRFDRVIYSFTPDLFDPSARAEAVSADEGVFQVRGAWPALPAFGISAVWEH